jgi:phenylalanyl-tRNA synthetase beta chain
MKVALRWLKEFVAVEAPVEEIARRLTVAGLEVENLEAVAPGFSGVLVARVLDVKKHPNADRLSLCQVDAGQAGHFSVVCGAANVRAGMKAALALVGAKLGSEPPLEAAVIRGVRSEGMLCSERELGFSDEHQGIISLPADAPIGTPLADYLGLEDTVLDIAVMPNRGDCLSVLGLARELAALFGAKLRAPRLKRLAVEAGQADREAGFTVEIAAPELCPRYAALKMTGVEIGPAPLWMRRRLELCGMRALNNVVDATNYVMLEMGQPLHAFDLAKIAGARIIVRRAGADREFVTLDGVNRALRPEDLLIADAEKPLAIAGVMGGLNSEVGDSTAAVLLESAYFEPIAIARTARRLGLASEASYRFERAVDRAGQVAALMRLAELLRKYAGARTEGPVADYEPRSAANRGIALDPKRVAALLGVEIPAAEVRRRLVALGATVKKDPGARGALVVTPPSYRSDLNETADLAEEIARLDGLEEVPAKLPERLFAYAAPSREREFFHGTREIMLGAGLTEIDTIAFVAPGDNAKFSGVHAGEPLVVENPLAAGLGEMRMSLVGGLLQALRFNLNRQAACFHAFEIAKVFFHRQGRPMERYALGGLSYGDYVRAEIGTPAVKGGFFTLKGVVESYLGGLGLLEGKPRQTDDQIARDPGWLPPGRVEFREPRQLALGFLHPGRSAEVTLGDGVIGYLGELHPREAMEAELTEVCAVFELDLEKLIAYGFSPRQMVEVPPKFPAVRRDLALMLDREFPADAVVKTVYELAPSLMEGAEVFDVYEGGSIPPGKKSVALALRYRAKDRTLTDEEVNRIHAAVVEQALARLGAELRQ